VGGRQEGQKEEKETGQWNQQWEGYGEGLRYAGGFSRLSKARNGLASQPPAGTDP
jgi:hypothetical protein